MKNLKHRLEMVKDDVISIRKALGGFDFDFEETDIEGSSVGTYLTNIEVACNLNSNESDGWGVVNKNELDFYNRVAEEKAIIVEIDKAEVVLDIIAKLKAIDINGEIMQHILKKVDMEGQILSQLVSCAEDREAIEIMLDESDKAWRTDFVERMKFRKLKVQKNELFYKSVPTDESDGFGLIANKLKLYKNNVEESFMGLMLIYCDGSFCWLLEGGARIDFSAVELHYMNS